MLIAGVDLAWMGTRNPTAIAVGSVDSRIVELASVFEGLHGTQSVIDALNGVENLHGVAIDGPLIIRNPTGQRECERAVGVRYGGRKASCHTSNLERFPAAAGVRLSEHLLDSGFRHLAPPDQRWQLECYPHPALIEIFGLSERLLYKKGTVVQRRRGQVELANMIRSLKDSSVLSLRVPDSLLSYMSESRINSLGGMALKHNEDVLDSIVCMYIGALYQSGYNQAVFGTALDGYIFVPTKRCT
ncbi:DUF429 domain-containing protein [Arenimonas sp. SCN 70-307]|uniref:DUF429 domain-containing protein n=1 Tax=Arenimonas sp. SCN 70-307 TaxID=1660089 RepID=UPI0025C4FA90|nr:DUF429 domain-containing protein [Arenimonas sp. SCN 70-307]